MDREAWYTAVNGVTRHQTRLSDWIELNWSSASELVGDQVHYQWAILLWKKFFVAVSLNSAYLVAEMVNYLPAVPETQAWSLGREDPQEKGMATHSSILAWRTSWTGEPGGLQSMRSQRMRHCWAANTSLLVSTVGLKIWVNPVVIRCVVIQALLFNC